MKTSWIITVKQGRAGPERGPSLLSFTEAKHNQRVQRSKEVGRRGKKKKRTEIHANSHRPEEGRGNPLFEIFVFHPPARPPCVSAGVGH